MSMSWMGTQLMIHWFFLSIISALLLREERESLHIMEENCFHLLTFPLHSIASDLAIFSRNEWLIFHVFHSSIVRAFRTFSDPFNSFPHFVTFQTDLKIDSINMIFKILNWIKKRLKYPTYISIQTLSYALDPWNASRTWLESTCISG